MKKFYGLIGFVVAGIFPYLITAALAEDLNPCHWYLSVQILTLLFVAAIGYCGGSLAVSLHDLSMSNRG
jgi:hypothetical protein